MVGLGSPTCRGKSGITKAEEMNGVLCKMRHISSQRGFDRDKRSAFELQHVSDILKADLSNAVQRRRWPNIYVGSPC